MPVGAPLDADGAFTAGPHTLQLQVPVAGGIAVFDVGVVVGGPVPGSVPAGAGPGVPSGLPLAGLLAVVAVAVLGVARARGRVDVIGTGGGARVPSARLASG